MPPVLNPLVITLETINPSGFATPGTGRSSEYEKLDDDDTEPSGVICPLIDLHVNITSHDQLNPDEPDTDSKTNANSFNFN